MSTLKDARNYSVSGATPKALELFEAALRQFQCYRGDPVAALDAAIEEAPDFVLAHCFKAHLNIVAAEKPGIEAARAHLKAASGKPVNAREAGHLAAIKAYVSGSWEGGIAGLEAVLADYPLDALALQTVHLSNFFIADARNLRDCVGRVRPYWDERVPGYHAVLGMHSFGLEETGNYLRAEAEGRRAINLEPHDAWAQHAVAHVLEMQGRVDEGVTWMTSRIPFWAEENFFAVHNWWHLALYHLDRGENEEVLRIYDDHIRAGRSKVVLDMVDASALLWRLRLRGIDVGDRWTEIAETWAPLAEDGFYAFNDLHALMAFIGAGREDLTKTLIKTMEAQTGTKVSNARMTGDVGLPLAKAYLAFEKGDYDAAVDSLLRTRPIAQRFGGSHAQRDIVDLTLAEAALRTGRHGLATAIANERDELKPGHSVAAMIRARVAAGEQPRAANA